MEASKTDAGIICFRLASRHGEILHAHESKCSGAEHLGSRRHMRPAIRTVCRSIKRRHWDTLPLTSTIAKHEYLPLARSVIRVMGRLILSPWAPKKGVAWLKSPS